MIKNIFKYFLLFLLVFILAGCEFTQQHTHEYVNGKCECGATDPDYDPFNDTYNYVTPQTDALKLTDAWEGKDFVKDGIGEVTVSQFVDGDTAHFKTKSGEKITCRFSGVNTPESTYKVEPWGFAASSFTKSKLKNAYKIVLQSEDMSERFDSTGERYLTWVWLISEDGDSRLLNLELVEVALAKAKANDTIYAKNFSDAVYDVTINRCRVYGYNNDPDYDYSKESQAMSLKEIKENYGSLEAGVQGKDKGKKVVISGVVTRRDGICSAYIQQYNEEDNQYYGVYVYGGYNPKTELEIGNSVVIEGKIGYYFGTLQITDIKVKVKQFAPSDLNSVIVTKVIEKTEDININNTDLIGSLVNISNLTVTGGTDDDKNNAFTIKTTYVNSQGQSVRLDIRVGDNINLKGPDGRITSYQYFNGKTIKSLTAIVSYYDYNTDDANNGYIQMMLTSFEDIVLE